MKKNITLLLLIFSFSAQARFYCVNGEVHHTEKKYISTGDSYGPKDCNNLGKIAKGSYYCNAGNIYHVDKGLIINGESYECSYNLDEIIRGDFYCNNGDIHHFSKGVIDRGDSYSQSDCSEKLKKLRILNK
ncbi:MAG: hypothetical protein HON90_10365 [Halobacteriovoraceae bacterium]|jgi:hypothetical protein|nr:hypothetical protein [Halobacteriovoraceae bacterium]